MAKINVGDRVCYSRKFLQNIGVYTGDMPQGRGKVVGNVMPLGDNFLAQIEWEKGADLPTRVNSGNLSRITAARGIEEPV